MTERQRSVFWMIVRAVDEVCKDAGYVDARLSHRVDNLCRGLLMTGREPECLNNFLDKNGKLRCHVACGCNQRQDAYPYCNDRQCYSRMVWNDFLNKNATGGGE